MFGRIFRFIMESTLTKYSMWWRKMYFLIVLQKMLWFNGKPKINESYIDKNTYIVEKYLNLFVRALETGRKSILCWAFLPCFEASANELYIFRQRTYIVFIMQCKKAQGDLVLRFWPTGKRSQPSQGDVFARIALQRELAITFILCML